MLELVGQEGLLPGEAARLLGISPVAARMRLARARKKARQALERGEQYHQTVVVRRHDLRIRQRHKPLVSTPPS